MGEVLKFEAGAVPAEESRVRDIEEIMNYRRAMRRAEEELKTRPFSLNLLKELHAVASGWRPRKIQGQRAIPHHAKLDRNSRNPH